MIYLFLTYLCTITTHYWFSFLFFLFLWCLFLIFVLLFWKKERVLSLSFSPFQVTNQTKIKKIIRIFFFYLKLFDLKEWHKYDGEHEIHRRHLDQCQLSQMQYVTNHRAYWVQFDEVKVFEVKVLDLQNNTYFPHQDKPNRLTIQSRTITNKKDLKRSNDFLFIVRQHDDSQHAIDQHNSQQLRPPHQTMYHNNSNHMEIKFDQKPFFCLDNQIIVLFR